MTKGTSLLRWVAALAGPALWAQYAPAPTTYTVTQVNALLSGPNPYIIYRDGSKVAFDHPDRHSRSVLDLSTHTSHAWDLQQADATCSDGKFSGDWGDPFDSADLDQMMKSPAPVGSETINGFATRVTEATDPASKIKLKVWRETKYGLVIRVDLTQPGSPTQTAIETKSFSLAKPDPALFVVPKACSAPPTPPEMERFKQETGDPAGEFADGIMGPGSSDSCTMLMRFVAAGSMKPVSGFQIALDLNYDQNHPPHYTDAASNGKTVFAGGNIKEYTSQIQNGTLRIDNVPAAFYTEITFAGGSKGGGESLVYRKCSGPQTVLLFVMKDPDNIGKGNDWIWVKSGKLAAH